MIYLNADYEYLFWAKTAYKLMKNFKMWSRDQTKAWGHGGQIPESDYHYLN